jgi:hypothetical protein
MSSEFEIKAPADGILPDFVPQENITGDVLRGYGPRRGNLERLLRYWRPIMRKPGGFRRCRVILANHPELYPLDRICAWLHHETTGLWPNEGCHHPGMKNCRGKLKKRNWSNAEFARSLRRAVTPDRGKKDAFEDVFFHEFKSMEEDFSPVVTESDFSHAMNVLADFVEMEEKFIDYIRDSNNWEIEGEDEDGNMKLMPFESVESKSDCCGGDAE